VISWTEKEAGELAFYSIALCEGRFKWPDGT